MLNYSILLAVGPHPISITSEGRGCALNKRSGKSFSINFQLTSHIISIDYHRHYSIDVTIY